jgi:hypothetical protein
MKRKASEDNLSKERKNRVSRIDNNTLSFLEPLKKKIDLSSDYERIIRDSNNRAYEPLYYKQIANFVSNQLANKTSSIDKSELEKIITTHDNAYSDYNPDSKEISISSSSASPFSDFIHEGTHALDNLHMRTYQKEALDFLAKHARDRQGNSLTPSQDFGYWYEGARKIIPSRTFNSSKNYNFGVGGYTKATKNDPNIYPKNVKQNIIEGVEQVRNPTNPLKTYIDAKNSYQILTNKNSEFLNPLSEFIAFGVENLNKPWSKRLKNIDYNNKDFLTKDHGPNLGRKFLKKMTKATYTGFKDIYNQQPNPNQGQSFMQAYPDIHNAFLDRLSDLRNVNKHSDANTFKQTMYNRLYPSLNTPMTTTSTTPTNLNPLLNAMTPTPTNSPTFTSIRPNRRYSF